MSYLAVEIFFAEKNTTVYTCLASSQKSYFREQGFSLALLFPELSFTIHKRKKEGFSQCSGRLCFLHLFERSESKSNQRTRNGETPSFESGRLSHPQHSPQGKWTALAVRKGLERRSGQKQGRSILLCPVMIAAGSETNGENSATERKTLFRRELSGFFATKTLTGHSTITAKKGSPHFIRVKCGGFVCPLVRLINHWRSLAPPSECNNGETMHQWLHRFALSIRGRWTEKKDLLKRGASRRIGKRAKRTPPSASESNRTEANLFCSGLSVFRL